MLCSKAAVARTTKVTLLPVEVRNPTGEMLQSQSLSWNLPRGGWWLF